MFNLHSNSSFDILFLFHSFDLKYHPDLIEYYQSKIAAKCSRKSQRQRYALSYYDIDKYNRRFIEMNQFKDSKNFKSKIINDVTEIKAEVLNLDWDRKSFKLVINIIKGNYSVVGNVVGYLAPDKNVDSIFSSEDPIGKQIKYENINFRKEYVKETHINFRNVDEILSENFLFIQTREQIQEAYLKELYFLKRNSFSTFDEYKLSQKEKVFSEKYKSFPTNDKILITYEKYEKENELSSVKHKGSKKLEFKFKKDISEPTRNLFLISAKFYGATRQGLVWVEILTNEISLKRILDIHLTAECLVDHFKTLKSSSLKFNIAQISRINFDSKSVIGVCTYEDLSKSEIKTPCEHKFQAMECFTHFTFEKTNRILIVLDLRTLRFKNEYIITEPVIFSTIPNRFGSSDLGIKGIENFMSQHKCNSYCKEIGLRRLN